MRSGTYSRKQTQPRRHASAERLNILSHSRCFILFVGFALSFCGPTIVTAARLQSDQPLPLLIEDKPGFYVWTDDVNAIMKQIELLRPSTAFSNEDRMKKLPANQRKLVERYLKQEETLFESLERLQAKEIFVGPGAWLRRYEGRRAIDSLIFRTDSSPEEIQQIFNYVESQFESDDSSKPTGQDDSKPDQQHLTEQEFYRVRGVGVWTIDDGYLIVAINPFRLREIQSELRSNDSTLKLGEKRVFKRVFINLNQADPSQPSISFYANNQALKMLSLNLPARFGDFSTGIQTWNQVWEYAGLDRILSIGGRIEVSLGSAVDSTQSPITLDAFCAMAEPAQGILAALRHEQGLSLDWPIPEGEVLALTQFEIDGGILDREINIALEEFQQVLDANPARGFDSGGAGYGLSISRGVDVRKWFGRMVPALQQMAIVYSKTDASLLSSFPIEPMFRLRTQEDYSVDLRHMLAILGKKGFHPYRTSWQLDDWNGLPVFRFSDEEMKTQAESRANRIATWERRIEVYRKQLSMASQNEAENKALIEKSSQSHQAALSLRDREVEAGYPIFDNWFCMRASTQEELREREEAIIDSTTKAELLGRLEQIHKHCETIEPDGKRCGLTYWSANHLIRQISLPRQTRIRGQLLTRVDTEETFAHASELISYWGVTTPDFFGLEIRESTAGFRIIGGAFRD